jgi:hypothetical protein
MIVSPVPTITDLQTLKLQGFPFSGGVDVAILQTANGDVHGIGEDDLLDLAGNWSGAEFNIFGDTSGFEAFLNSGSALTVRLQVNNGTTNAPTCYSNTFGINSWGPASLESNNLNLTGGCSTVGGALPAIVFSETGGGSLPPGYTVGDTHLTTFYQVHYDFQASGDFVLVQADPGLVVQTRQTPAATYPSVSLNTAVAEAAPENRTRG